MNTVISKKISVLSIEHPFERLAMRGLVLMLIGLSAGYLYLVAASVLNVMARKEATVQTTQIEGRIGNLETQYFGLSQNITPAVGAALGLSTITQTDYVNRPGTVGDAGTPASDII